MIVLDIIQDYMRDSYQTIVSHPQNTDIYLIYSFRAGVESVFIKIIAHDTIVTIYGTGGRGGWVIDVQDPQFFAKLDAIIVDMMRVWDG